MCDGSAVSRETYAALFAVISTTYGAGNGSTTFNVPDMRQRFPLGKAASGTGATLGSTGGAINHTHTGGTISGSTANESSHTHGAGSYQAPAHDHTGDTEGVSSGTEVLVDANGGGVQEQTLSEVPSVETHFHGIPTQAAATITGTSAAGSAHSHGVGTLAVGSSGTDNPPFLAVNWIVKT
jgi:microcystin-dependent protein